MLAVVNIHGNQFKVKKEDKIFVPFIDAKEGDSLEFKDIVLLYGEDGSFSIGNEDNKVIKAEVKGHISGEKIISFKMKRRKGFRKKKGHKTKLTILLINDIV